MSHPSSVFFTTLHISLSQHKIPSLSIPPNYLCIPSGWFHSFCSNIFFQWAHTTSTSNWHNTSPFCVASEMLILQTWASSELGMCITLPQYSQGLASNMLFQMLAEHKNPRIIGPYKQKPLAIQANTLFPQCIYALLTQDVDYEIQLHLQKLAKKHSCQQFIRALNIHTSSNRNRQIS